MTISSLVTYLSKSIEQINLYFLVESSGSYQKIIFCHNLDGMNVGWTCWKTKNVLYNRTDNESMGLK